MTPKAGKDGFEENARSPAGIRTRTVQPVANRYTDNVISAPVTIRIPYNKRFHGNNVRAPTRTRTRTVQPVANRYTDNIISAPVTIRIPYNKLFHGNNPEVDSQSVQKCPEFKNPNRE